MHPTEQRSASGSLEVQAQLTLFSALWALSILADRASRSMTTDLSKLALAGAAVYLLLRPSSLPRLIVLSAAHLYFFVTQVRAIAFPDVALLHWYFAAFLHLIALLAWLWCAIRDRQMRVDAGRFLGVFGPGARLLACVAFFLAGFSKLNRAYLDPALSCGAVLYDMQSAVYPALLPTGDWARKAAIWISLGVEMLSPVLLLIPRTRIAGFLLVAPLLFLIGVNPVGNLYEFTGQFLALFVLLLPALSWADLPEAPRRLVERLREGAGRRRELIVIGIVLLGAWFAYRSDMTPAVHLYRTAAMRTSFAVAMLAVSALLLLRLRRGNFAPRRPMLRGAPPWVYVLVLLFVANESTTYLGLKRQFNFSMAGNLVLNRRASNHLLVRHPPALDANEIVEILDASKRAAVRPKTGMPWLYFRNYIATHPWVWVRFRRGGETVELRSGERPPPFDHETPVLRYVYPHQAALWPDQRCHHRHAREQHITERVGIAVAFPTLLLLVLLSLGQLVRDWMARRRSGT